MRVRCPYCTFRNYITGMVEDDEDEKLTCGECKRTFGVKITAYKLLDAQNQPDKGECPQ